jgi:hypothetical protein
MLEITKNPIIFFANEVKIEAKRWARNKYGDSNKKSINIVFSIPENC